MQECRLSPPGETDTTVLEVLREHVAADARVVSSSSSLADLGIGSLKLIKLIITLQKRLCAPRVPVDRVAGVKTVGDLLKLFGRGGSLEVQTERLPPVSR